ncbi:MAG: methylenetetrahydrofolate--tRNA-(uracil(54)-C(5))-methyltransferase (FADH(2)-oxidizing) TrmFO [Deltaproteobacteria bacterium]|nr:methylenetetrahydrofolate--tRNA-(uracil(54)-C(5))-methyltransferase (FADH(2)-oxidizing) TrmFO [Deltaproteobacteria bacterium]
MAEPVIIVGGGLAGVEAAWRLARSGIGVQLLEMRPDKSTPAHQTGLLAELVCSNSLRSAAPASAVGLLKEEMVRLDSLVMEAALATRVPAGKALAVDREAFAGFITGRITALPGVELIREEAAQVPRGGLVILASGPLTSDSLAQDLVALTGAHNLYFYDAIAPIIEADSVDTSRAWWASRYADVEDEADYLNCPLSEAEYDRFYAALMDGDKVPLRDFEESRYFEGCLPIEVMAERGKQTLLFGPLKPVGLADPTTGQRPHGVLQLRKEDAAGRYLNLVGCQTRLTQPAQKEAFRLVPALKEAVFTRLGSVHRNTFVRGPEVLNPDLSLKAGDQVFLAGQITGVEGYVESAACGLLAGEFVRQRLSGQVFNPPPAETALGSLLRHATAGRLKNFQPSNIHFGLFLPLADKTPKKRRGEAYANRAREALATWLSGLAV